jgi:hypothetical protein
MQIFHGISTPKYPAYDWNRTENWGAMGHFNFKRLARLADVALVDWADLDGLQD